MKVNAIINRFIAQVSCADDDRPVLAQNAVWVVKMEQSPTGVGHSHMEQCGGKRSATPHSIKPRSVTDSFNHSRIYKLTLRTTFERVLSNILMRTLIFRAL